jgi:hypothetical protein
MGRGLFLFASTKDLCSAFSVEVESDDFSPSMVSVIAIPCDEPFSRVLYATDALRPIEVIGDDVEAAR